ELARRGRSRVGCGDWPSGTCRPTSSTAGARPCGRPFPRAAPRCGRASTSSTRASNARPGTSLVAMPDRPTTAHALRRAFLGFVDYFRADAIGWAMELYRDVLELDMSRVWVTVHDDDDEAERIWRDEVGFPAERIQRLGEENFWRMGDTGPCGPSSEIFWDLGPGHGPEGGPATGHDRYIEIWNLVFMQYDQHADGSRAPLPRPSIDTGAGLERNLM